MIKLVNVWKVEKSREVAFRQDRPSHHTISGSKDQVKDFSPIVATDYPKAPMGFFFLL